MGNIKLFIDSYLNLIIDRIKNEKGQDLSRGDAFEIFSIAVILGRSFQDVYNNIVIKGFVEDGKKVSSSDDGGIDGVDFVEVDNEYDMHVFQCKSGVKLVLKDLEKLKSDYKKIFEDGEWEDKLRAAALKNKVELYRELTNARRVIKPKLYFIYNGLNDDPDRSANQELYNRFNKPEKGFEVWDARRLYNQIRAYSEVRHQQKNIEFTFAPESDDSAVANTKGIYNSLYTFTLGNVRAANFRIKANQLCELIDRETETNGTDERLFADNVRGYLGRRAKANKKMEETIDSPDYSIYFPVMNNGITIICDTLSIPTRPQDGKYLITTTNPVIVNGLQTSKVLYKKYKILQNSNQDLGRISVNIRLYRVEDEQLVDMITDATNTQTPINFRDKISNRDFNSWAKILFETRGIAYLTKRGEIFTNRDAQDLEENVNSDTVLQGWYATFYEEPEIAKNSKSKVLENIYDGSTSTHPLSVLFDGNRESPVYAQMLVSYYIYTTVKQRRHIENSSESYFLHADELLSYGTYKALEQLGQLGKAFERDQGILNAAYRTALSYVANIYSAVEEEYKKQNKPLSIPGYFKSARSRYDYNRIAGISETTSGIINELLQKHIG